MTSRDFAFWLQGFFELTGSQSISALQAEMIRQHLQLVFKHEISPPQGLVPPDQVAGRQFQREISEAQRRAAEQRLREERLRGETGVITTGWAAVGPYPGTAQSIC